MKVSDIIKSELTHYLTESVELSGGINYSEYRTKRRILIYATQTYPTGKLDSESNYKYWFDIIGPRIDAELKNTDIDRKDVFILSNNKRDNLRNIILNLKIRKWMDENDQGEELNDAREEGIGWGNNVFEKTKDGYERVDLTNFYVINTTARSLKETPVIKRVNMTQDDLRKKIGIWKNVQEVIDNCANKEFRVSEEENPAKSEIANYIVYQRDGELPEDALFEAMGKKGGDPNKYVLARVIVCGIEKGKDKNEELILFADELPEMPYEEFHRGRYEGRWLRRGMIELLMDLQTRANEVGNQLARGLEWASQIIFSAEDALAAQNLKSDLKSGDVLKAKGLQQVVTRLQGFDQLANEWNRIIVQANEIANSPEIIFGENLPSGTPFRLGERLNQNANKMFSYVREKFALTYKNVLEKWVLPKLIDEVRQEELIEISEDEDLIAQYQQELAKAWYVRNLLQIGPHGPEEARTIIQHKAEELLRSPGPTVVRGLEKSYWEGYKKRAKVVITGERMNIEERLQTLSTFIQLETDPVRRTALIEEAMMLRGMNVSTLPKSTPEQLTGVKPSGELAKEKSQFTPVEAGVST